MRSTTRPILGLIAQTLVDTPLGVMRLAATARGLAGAWFEDQHHHPGPLTAPDLPDHPVIAAAADALAHYWRDPHASLTTVAMDPQGTTFQRKVWLALQTIAPATTVTYAELARVLEMPKASRAVGMAIGRNPISILIPCHRVLGSNGSLTGYAGGLDRKQALLTHEQ